METRKLFVAIAAALAVYLLYTTIYNALVPEPERPVPTSNPTASSTPAVVTPPAGPAPSEPATRPQGNPTQLVASQPASSPALTAAQADAVERFTLGGGADDKLQIELTSRGAAIETIKLAERKRGKYVHAFDADTDEPYVLLRPIEGSGGDEVDSFETSRIMLGTESVLLGNLQWKVVEHDDRMATFETTLRSAADGADRLRIVKTYTLPAGSAAMRLRLRVENLSDRVLDGIRLEQDGPVGITKEHLQYDMRRLIRARRDEGGVEVKAWNRDKLERLLKKNPPETQDLGSSADGFLWTALANKYYAVFTRPLPQTEGVPADYIERVSGTVALPTPKDKNPGDCLAKIFTKPAKLEPGAAAEYEFEVYTGTKNKRDLEKANPAYIDRNQIGYIAAADADSRCCCAFSGLTQFMTWMLEAIRSVVRNYGIAIIILVLIIRSLLHPLTVFQQKSMYRMQEAQARLKPRIDAIKEKYPNDRQKQNQEQMKIYSEEGVNPMAGMVGMLPMLLQMPILIALWTALNTDVHLRHAGFDPWWITDLSAPDQFIKFAHPFSIPVLSQIPGIGRMFTDIPSVNLLPLLMGVSMWLQQKYMPKPGMQAKLDAAKKAAAEKKPSKHKGGMSPDDQMRQQQMMAYMMSILFPLMFYYWPSGLNLYWFSTNVFGIAESLIIRKQLEQEKERRKILGPEEKAPKQPGPLGRVFKRMAARAEELQKKADELSKTQGKQRGPKDRK